MGFLAWRKAHYTVTCSLSVAIKDTATGVDISGTFTHATPARGSQGITPASIAARFDECGGVPFSNSARVGFGLNLNASSYNTAAGFTRAPKRLKWGDWVYNTPVLSNGGLLNGDTFPVEMYLQVSEDTELPDTIDNLPLTLRKGQTLTVGVSTTGVRRWYLWGGPKAYPEAAKTRNWAYNSDPIAASGGLLNGLPANYNTCLISDSAVEFIDPPIDNVTSLFVGQVIQCCNGVWDYASAGDDTPWMGPNFDCVDFNQIQAFLPSNSEPPGLLPFPNLFLGYYPPPQFQDPQSIRYRVQFAASGDKTIYLIFEDTGGNTYQGLVTMDTSNSWSGSNAYGTTTVDVTYNYTLAPV